jgi:hypothetical protein
MGGDTISTADPMHRQKAVSTVSAVSRSGQFAFEVSDVRLTANSTHFVVEVSSVELDAVGRVAPLICYGPLDECQDNRLGVQMVEGLLEFAGRIGRTVSADSISDIHQALTKLRAALKRAERVRKIVMGSIAVVGALVLARCLTTEKHVQHDSENPSQGGNHLEGRQSR